MTNQEPKPLRWPLVSVFAALLIAGLAGCYYYPEDYGHRGYPVSGTYGYSRCHVCGGYHAPGHCRYHGKKHKPAKYKPAKYKHPKHPKHPHFH